MLRQQMARIIDPTNCRSQARLVFPLVNKPKGKIMQFTRGKRGHLRAIDEHGNIVGEEFFFFRRDLVVQRVDSFAYRLP